MDAVEPGTTNPVRFRLHFAGARIFDAAVATLRQDGAAALRYTLGGASSSLPDLDDASVVLLAGASAGGAGTIRNVDRFATTLRANNSACRSGGACPLRVAALIDSILPMDRSQLDWTLTPVCTMGMLCSYAQYFQTQYQTGENVFQGVRNDDTCESWHRANRPGEEWRCMDDSYVLLNHITTPMFVRMGQTDMLLGRNAVEAQFQVPGMGPLTMPQFAAGVRAQLQRAQDAQTLANERAMIRTAPGDVRPELPEARGHRRQRQRVQRRDRVWRRAGALSSGVFELVHGDGRGADQPRDAAGRQGQLHHVKSDGVAGVHRADRTNYGHTRCSES
jgi:hypothetical protein